MLKLLNDEPLPDIFLQDIKMFHAHTAKIWPYRHHEGKTKNCKISHIFEASKYVQSYDTNTPLGKRCKKNQNLNEFVERGFRIQLFPKNFAGAPRRILFVTAVRIAVMKSNLFARVN